MHKQVVFYKGYLFLASKSTPAVNWLHPTVNSSQGWTFLYSYSHKPEAHKTHQRPCLLERVDFCRGSFVGEGRSGTSVRCSCGPADLGTCRDGFIILTGLKDTHMLTTQTGKFGHDAVSSSCVCVSGWGACRNRCLSPACLHRQLVCCFLFSWGRWIPLVVDLKGGERLERECVFI